MYKPKPTTVRKLDRLEKEAKKIINRIENKVGKNVVGLEFKERNQIQTANEMQKYIKELERVVSLNKTKKIGSKDGLYVLEQEYKDYQSKYKKALEKIYKFNDTINKTIRRSKSGYNKINNLARLMDRLNVVAIGNISSRNEFEYELNNLKKILRKDFFKNEIGAYKKSYLEAVINEIYKIKPLDYIGEILELMNKIKNRLETMHFKTFYKNYYSGKLRDINEVYTVTVLLRQKRYGDSYSTAIGILRGLS